MQKHKTFWYKFKMNFNVDFFDYVAIIFLLNKLRVRKYYERHKKQH